MITRPGGGEATALRLPPTSAPPRHTSPAPFVPMGQSVLDGSCGRGGSALDQPAALIPFARSAGAPCHLTIDFHAIGTNGQTHVGS